MEQNGSDGNNSVDNDHISSSFYYDMTNAKRGIAIIFNHQVFENPEKWPRKGTNADCDKLFRTLSNLHFKVQIHNDLRLGDIMHKMREVSELDFSDNDCILMVILSHGVEGLQVSAHDSDYDLASIFHYFKEGRCPTLKGKPKLFFIQACQGRRTDDGITLKYEHVHESNNHQEPEFRLKNGFIGCYNVVIPPDFLIAYSTIPGFYSFRNCNGSWFIQTLCDQLNANGKKQDILTLLTFVKQYVAMEYSSNTQDMATNDKRQIPSTITTLTRLLKFTDKDICSE